MCDAKICPLTVQDEYPVAAFSILDTVYRAQQRMRNQQDILKKYVTHTTRHGNNSVSKQKQKGAQEQGVEGSIVCMCEEV
jgi:S-adenosylmethionine/arginine decarboxylase-like enzyme